jgi:hypothetical protein
VRIVSRGQAAYAAILIALGIQGLITHQLTAVWAPVPKWAVHTWLAYLCALIFLGSGVGLLAKPTSAMASRVLLAALVLWTLVFRVPPILRAPLGILPWDGCAETVVMVSAAWVLFAWFATDADRHRLAFATGDRGVRIARVLYGLAMIPFGLAHFAYIKETASLVPHWIPGHLAWAYFTGGAFLAAGAAILLRLRARLAAALSALQIGLFTLLVWVPIVAGGTKDPYQWSEFAVSCALTAGAWVVADSYGETRMH